MLLKQIELTAVWVMCWRGVFSAKMDTLPFESQMNITAMTLSPTGHILIAVSEGKTTCVFNPL